MRRQLKADLTYLTDRIGPRLTGSRSWMRRAIGPGAIQGGGPRECAPRDWTIANSWTRGPATGRLVVPAEQTLTLASAGWSPCTKGPVRGPVVGVRSKSWRTCSPTKGNSKARLCCLGSHARWKGPWIPR